MPDAPAAGGGGKGEILDPLKQALFCVCGLYELYWIWMRVKELNTYLGRQAINPLFILCCPAVCWFLAKAVAEAEKKAGLNVPDQSLMDFLYMFAPFWGIMNIQKKLNAIWQK